MMIKNYFKIAFRNLIRQKGYSSINKLGFAIQMAVCILLLLWVRGELYSAQLLENKNNLYRIVHCGIVNQGEQYGNPKVTYDPAPILEDLSHKLSVNSRLLTFDGMFNIYETSNFSNNRLFQIKPALKKMFSFPFIKDDKAMVLSKLLSHVITREASEYYFGDEYPIGKVLNLHNRSDFTITGLVEKIPRNSSFDFSFVVPFMILGKEHLGSWFRKSHFYQLTKDNISYTDNIQSNQQMICTMNNGRFICAK